MGVRYLEALFLLDCLDHGAALGRSLNVGRQSLLCEREELVDALARYRRRVSPADLDRIYSSFVDLPNNDYSGRLFCEPLFKLLGATEIVSVDCSSFELATLIHDFNEPLPANLVGGFDSVLDFGTLEHIFNVPVALANMLRAVKPGGHYIAALPCNNLPGHGFYQFSPEFFFSVLAPHNGFDIECILLADDTRRPSFRRLPDPRQVKGRVTFTNSTETSIFVCARRVGDVPAALAAYQSDYVEIWEAAKGARAKPAGAPPPNSLVLACAAVYRAIVPEAVRRLRLRAQAWLNRPRGVREFPRYP